MGTTLGTIKAAINADYGISSPPPSPQDVEAASKLFIAARGLGRWTWAPLQPVTNRCCQGSAVIPRRDYGPKQ